MMSSRKKIMAFLFVILVWMVSFGGIHVNFGKAVLDVSEGAGAVYSDALTSEVTVSGGQMSFKVPKTFLSVGEVLDSAPGMQYRLNEIPETYAASAEQLYVFYFESEEYLLYAKDAKNTAAVEMAIVQNILPGEKVGGIVNGWSFPSASKHNVNGTVFDYYDSEYKDVNNKTHYVEFVFTKNGTKGLGCVLYVFTEYPHKEDVLYVLNSIRFAR